MGCHTWFYKPTTKTTEEIRSNVINFIRRKIEYYKDIRNRDKFNEEFGGKSTYWSEKDFNKTRVFYERSLRRIQSGSSYWSVLIYSRRFHNSIVYYTNGVFYEDFDLHDVFRIKGYPKNLLTTFEDTLGFIKTNSISIDDEGLRTIKEFFDIEPKGGLIRFG